MGYTLRAAGPADIPAIVAHRERMFRDMGTPAAFAAMAERCTEWLDAAIPAGVYRGWFAESPGGEVVAGAGVIVFPWPPGPMSVDPRCACVVNVYTEPAHRRRGLARLLVETIHGWCGAEGIQRVMLNASPAGHPLYAAMGYKVAEQPMMMVTLGAELSRRAARPADPAAPPATPATGPPRSRSRP